MPVAKAEIRVRCQQMCRVGEMAVIHPHNLAIPLSILQNAFDASWHKKEKISPMNYFVLF